MLILASTSDVVQVVTGGAGLVDVHASWMDNASGAVLPGRTNTANIATATTTTVVPAPVAQVQRNVKTLHIRNGGVSQVVGVLLVDPTGAFKLWEQRLEQGATLQYIDEIGFKARAEPARVTVQKFDVAGSFTYTPTPGMTFATIECIGGGGSSGDAAWGIGRGSGGGGGSGGYSRKLVSASDIGASQPVTVGGGGTYENSPNGAPGGLSAVGTLCRANGGGGGGHSLNGDNTPVGGQPASTAGAIGDITAGGSPGEQGGYVYFPAGSVSPDDPIIIPDGGRGASGPWGGGAPMPAVGTTGSVGGIAAGKYGSGGSGAVSNTTGGYLGLGVGSVGLVFITEFCFP